MLAILDTQILSIFHRKKGDRHVDGAWRDAGSGDPHVHAGRRVQRRARRARGAVYGIPLLGVRDGGWGCPMPAAIEQAGFSIGERIYPRYGAVLVLGTTVLVLVVTTIVSYLPTRRIAHAASRPRRCAGGLT